MLDSLPAHVCVLNKAGVILRTNDAWKRFAQENSEPGAHVGEVGDNYLEVCRRAIAGGDTTARVMLEGIESILEGQQAMFSVEYPCHAPQEGRWFLLRATSLKDGGGAVLSHLNITERKAAEEKLREREEWLRQVLEETSTAVWDWNIQDGNIFWSPQHFTMLGYEPNGVEPSYAHWAARVHPEDRAITEVAVRDAMERHGEYRHQFRSLWPDGTIRWIEAHGRYSYDLDGQCTRMIGLMWDITDRKQAEAQLVESELRFRALVERVGDVFWISDPTNRKLVYVSQTFADIWGRSLKDLHDHFETWIDAIHDDDRARVAKDFFENAPAGTYDTEYRVVRPDGSIRWIRDRGKPLGIGNLFAGVAEDITERRQAEDALRQSEERFRGIFEHAAEGIAITDFKGQFQRCNPAFCAIVGYSAEELSAMRFSVLIHPEDSSHNMALIRQLMSGSIPFFEVTNRYVTKSGEPAWVSKHVSILRNDKGEPTYLMGIVTDVTVRRQAEEALQRSQEALREYQEQLQDLTAKLLGSQERERQRIARELHDDVSQRLAALVLDVSSLERQSPPASASMVRALESIRTQLDQLADDVHGLAYRLHPSLLNHAGLRPAIADHLHEVTRRTGIPVVFTARQVPDALPQEHATCLFRVMQESVQNVVKHACATEVTVRLSGSPEGVGLSVSDNGRGFDPEDEVVQEKGLGLASMQERLRLVNGFLRIHSMPGQGAKVCAWIPRAQEGA